MQKISNEKTFDPKKEKRLRVILSLLLLMAAICVAVPVLSGDVYMKFTVSILFFFEGVGCYFFIEKKVFGEIFGENFGYLIGLFLAIVMLFVIAMLTRGQWLFL